MKEIKFKWLWAVDDANGVQWGAFRYKKEAKQFAIKLNCPHITKRKLLTTKY